MLKRSVYLDTTIISYLFDGRPELQSYVNVTQEWWQKESQNFNIFSSNETIVELRRGNYPHQKQALDFVENITLLPRTIEVEKAAEIYVQKLVMPRDTEGDAIHLAYVSVYKIDFLLTWNCKHLANAGKKHHIRHINTLLGLYIPEIITPLELFTGDTHADE